jgi:hypothetical protein
MPVSYSDQIGTWLQMIVCSEVMKKIRKCMNRNRGICWRITSARERAVIQCWVFSAWCATVIRKTNGDVSPPTVHLAFTVGLVLKRQQVATYGSCVRRWTGPKYLWKRTLVAYFSALWTLHGNNEDAGTFSELVSDNVLEPSRCWETNSRRSSHKILLLLWNPKVRYRFHENPLLRCILSEMNPLNTRPF